MRRSGAGDPELPGICPGCGAYERHRALMLYLRERTDVFERPVDLLECAPLGGFIAGAPNVRYVSVDIDSPYAQVRADLMDLPFGPESFDVILCVHVLEHVADDRRAMRELRRVLRPDGFAAILVPVQPGRPETFEDPDVRSPDERERLFGQADHVRVYGEDFAQRLAATGFEVERVSMFESLGPEGARRHGLSPRDDIFVARPAG